MTPKQPPVVATWLLRHLGSSPNNDAVLGDLAEEYSRKGAMWYWRQVLKAIPVSAFREARGHKWMAARAVVVGLAVWTVFVVFYLMRPTLNGGLSYFGGTVIDESKIPTIASASYLLWAPVALSAVPFKPSNPVVFLLWIQILLPLTVWAICGWIVARVDIRFDLRDGWHRPQKSSGLKLSIHFHRDLVIVFACSILLLHLLLLGRYISLVGPAANGFLGPLAAYAAASVAAILLGGSWHRQKGTAT
jgi:hypothetical protein